MPDQNRVPTRASAVIFRGKATLLQARRAVVDRKNGVRRFDQGEATAFPFVWAQISVPLWSKVEGAEATLERGKVHNMRRAVVRLDGVVVPAHQIFSFWKHVGRATRKRGFAKGRLLREGCLVPAMGGGLCALSNALYELALRADFEIVERHAHSQRVIGSVAVLSGRDATVAWNYVDLRFRAKQAMLIEARIGRDQMVISFRGQSARPTGSVDVTPRDFVPLAMVVDERGALDVTAHSCASCGVETCFRHDKKSVTRGQRAWLWDELWPEFQEFWQGNHEGNDVLLLPLDGAKWRAARYHFPLLTGQVAHFATFPTLQRAIMLRRAGNGGGRAALGLRGDQTLAAHYERHLSADITHLVIAQSLLPFLWRSGALGGRGFDVLATRLPLQIMHDRLDAAFARHPDCVSLGDFRAPCEIVEAESCALRQARRIITPHAEVATLCGKQSLLLPWKMPPRREFRRGDALIFPGPDLARKGTSIARAAGRALDMNFQLWDASAPNPLDGAAIVVAPSIIEERPQKLLLALASGVPVVASAACGLGAREGVTLVAPDDEAALSNAIRAALTLPVEPAVSL